MFVLHKITISTLISTYKNSFEINLNKPLLDFMPQTYTFPQSVSEFELIFRDVIIPKVMIMIQHKPVIIHAIQVKHICVDLHKKQVLEISHSNY